MVRRDQFHDRALVHFVGFEPDQCFYWKMLVLMGCTPGYMPFIAVAMLDFPYQRGTDFLDTQGVFRRLSGYFQHMVGVQDIPVLRGDDDGMLARFAVVWPDPAPIRRPRSRLDEATPQRAFKRILSLKPVIDENGSKRPLFISLDEPAQEQLDQFRIKSHVFHDIDLPAGRPAYFSYVGPQCPDCRPGSQC